MGNSDIGRRVEIKRNAKRQHGGEGVIRDFRMDNRPQRYLIERVDNVGKGFRKFWAARAEFEFIEPSSL
jgi:hypothetical protein